MKVYDRRGVGMMFSVARTTLCALTVTLAAAGYLQGPGVVAASAQARSAEATAVQTSNSVSAASPAPGTLLKQYCVVCHNQQLKTAGLLLDQADIEHVSA